MALREIITWPHPVLKKKASPVDRVDDTLKKLVEDMLETMYAAPGVGLAAPQVAVSVQLAVVDVAMEDGAPGVPVVLFNPKIIHSEGKIVWNEGCLSVPDFEEDIDRAEKITVQAIDKEGKEFRLDATGLQAVCIQHELDHLNGVTIADRVSFLKRNLYLQRVKKGKIERPRPGGRLVI